MLGLNAFGSGCNVTFSEIVYTNESAKLITYAVEVDEQGLCQETIWDMNWKLFPKISSDYEVEFEVFNT